jgi:hypothetical protein
MRVPCILIVLMSPDLLGRCHKWWVCGRPANGLVVGPSAAAPGEGGHGWARSSSRSNAFGGWPSVFGSSAGCDHHGENRSRGRMAVLLAGWGNGI